MPRDLITPQLVNVGAIVEMLQSCYLELVNDCIGIKMQQDLHLLRSADEVESASYTPAAYLQAVGGWRQRKHLAQLRTGSHWSAVETGRCGNSRVEQAKSCLCQRCDANSVDDVEHMIFDYCVAMDVERQKHQSLFACGQVALEDIIIIINIMDTTESAPLLCARLLLAKLAKSEY